MTVVIQGWKRHWVRVSTESWLWRRKFSHCSCRDSNSQPFHHESGALLTSYPGFKINTQHMGPYLIISKCSKVNKYSCLKLSLLRKAINVQKATTKNTENPDLKVIPHIRHSKKIYLPTGCVGASMCARRTFTASKGSPGAESNNENRINPNSILFRTSTTARQFTRVWVCAFMSMHKLLT